MLLQHILRILDYTRIYDCALDAIVNIAHSVVWGLNQAQAILALVRQQRGICSILLQMRLADIRAIARPV